MSGAVQPSLWAAHSADTAIGFGQLHSGERIQLSLDAWVEVHRNWVTGGFDLLGHLLDASCWRAERRRMYDAVVDVPRLLLTYGTGQHVPWAELVDARDRLSAHYLDELGEPFTSIGLCLYRNGRDSVAWHGDTIGRGATHDTLVAVLSLGATRTFALRPKIGGMNGGTGLSTIRLQVSHGDLLVMGGSCQRTWDHAIPKTARAVGPRVSVQFRPRGVA